LQALIKVREQLEMIEGLVTRIAALMRGDFKQAVSNLPGPKEVLIDKNPLFGPARFWAPKIGDALSAGGNMIGDWARGGWNSNSTMPAPAQSPAAAPTQQAPNITIPSITLTVKAPEGVTDPKGFATEMAPHIQELTYKAIQDAFGAARAQQAERR
jgi:hypothetical protein